LHFTASTVRYLPSHSSLNRTIPSVPQLSWVIKQEAQLPQRNSASAVHVYIGWQLANWSCNAQNTAESIEVVLAYFSCPSVIRRPRSLAYLWNFALKLTMRKLVMGLYILQWLWRPRDRSWSRFDTVPACDGQTGGQTDSQTDGFTIASTALSIASYADAL